jgi:hypothetical protein
MTTEHFLTIAFMASDLSRPYAAVLAAVAELKLTPALMLNATPYFTASDETRIFDYLQTKDEP